MPKVTYIEYNGTKFDVEVQDGWTLMQGATLNGVSGIEGECGGSCGCATCHIYIDKEWIGKLPTINDDEESMLDQAFNVKKESRLGCQIRLTEQMKGYKFTIVNED